MTENLSRLIKVCEWNWKLNEWIASCKACEGNGKSRNCEGKFPVIIIVLYLVSVLIHRSVVVDWIATAGSQLEYLCVRDFASAVSTVGPSSAAAIVWIIGG